MTTRPDAPVEPHSSNQNMADGREMTRRSVLRAGLAGVALVATPSFLLACGDEAVPTSAGGAAEGALGELRSKGVARLGLAEVLPSASVEDGRAVGIFPEVAEKVLQSLGVPKSEPVVGDFAGIIPSLQAGRVDLGVTGMYITPERCNAVLFSDPPLCFSEALAVRKGNPLGLRTYEDAAKQGARIGVLTASFELEMARKAGVEDIQQFPDLPAMFDAVKADRIDGGGYDDVTIAYMVAQPAYSDLESSEPYTPAGVSCGSIAFNKDAADLRDTFNKEQAKLLASGGLTPIFERWAVPQSSIDLAKEHTAEEFCA